MYLKLVIAVLHFSSFNPQLGICNRFGRLNVVFMSVVDSHFSNNLIFTFFDIATAMMTSRNKQNNFLTFLIDEFCSTQLLQKTPLQQQT